MLHCRLEQETDVALQARTRKLYCTAGYNKRRDVALDSKTRDVMLHCRLEQETDVALQATTRN